MYLLFSLRFVFLQLIGLGLVAAIVGMALYRRRKNLKKLAKRQVVLPAGLLVAGAFLFFFAPYLFMGKAEYPYIPTTFGPEFGPGIPLKNIPIFFWKSRDMEKVGDIARDPNDVPPAITRTAPDHVAIELEAKEVMGKLGSGMEYNYWTYNGTVPGPFLRVREGDIVDLTIKNASSSVHDHNIDLHAVSGPGGGGLATFVNPGKSKKLSFKALNPGLYVYNCAHPNVAAHMTHGLYGLILVEPKEGLPRVDKEFYLMQGELYTAGMLGKRGLQLFDGQKMLDGHPSYVLFNGRLGGAQHNMHIEAGERIRIYVGNGGVNLTSSFHISGEIFDEVYPEGSMGNGTQTHRNVQTALVPPGGATVVDFTAEAPGEYMFMDNAIARMDRGAWGTIEVEGEHNDAVFDAEHGSETHDHVGGN